MKGRIANRKLKGTVLDTTLRNIIRDAVKVIVDTTNGDVKYLTDKSTFLAKKKDVMYWDIYQIHGGE